MIVLFYLGDPRLPYRRLPISSTGNAKDDHADYEELDEEARSDEEQDEEQEAEDAEEWVDKDGNLGPEDGEAEEDNGYDEHYHHLSECRLCIL